MASKSLLVETMLALSQYPIGRVLWVENSQGVFSWEVFVEKANKVIFQNISTSPLLVDLDPNLKVIGENGFLYRKCLSLGKNIFIDIWAFTSEKRTFEFFIPTFTSTEGLRFYSRSLKCAKKIFKQK